MDDLLTSGSQIEKLLVGHPAIVPVEVHILYVAYDGWIYSGRFQWSLDKLVITDEYGKRTSFCKENGQHLPSGIPVKLKLKDGDCIASTLKVAPEYPLVPYRRVSFKLLIDLNLVGYSICFVAFALQYPNKPYDHLPHHKILPASKKSPPENKIVASSGQDGLYIANAVASDAEVTITINDEVAPKSVPSQIVTFNNGKEVKERPLKIYRNPPEKIIPPLRALPKVSGQGHSHLPKIPHPLVKWPTHHQYAPHHSSYYGSAPGPWNVATSRPINIPPSAYQSKRPPQLDNGIEVRYGPKFPTPPSHPTGQFPARRRPSTQFSHQRPIITHRRPPIRTSSPDSLSSGTHIGPQYHSRPMDKSDTDVTQLIDTSNEFEDQSDPTESDEMKMEFMSDDQLTIVKIGTEDELNRSNNNSVDLDTDNQENNTKIDYIVFHKLPNGEALNLENLRTYNMSDIAQGKVQDPELDEIDMAMFDQPEEEPRGFDTFNVNEGNDALRPDAFDSQRIHSIAVTKTVKQDETDDANADSVIEDDYYDQSNNEDEPVPDTKALKISTQSPPEEEVYSPTPLKDLEDLDAMPFQGDKPVYIIHEEDLVEDHPYFTSFKNKHIPRMEDSIVPSESEQAEMEILKVNVDRKDRRIDSFDHSLPSTNSPAQPEPTKMTFDWVPIPTKTPVPIFGPPNKPARFKNKPIDVEDVQQMTNIASVALTNKGPLAEEVNNSPLKDRLRPISLQYLPKRFTTILSRITDKERSLNSPQGWPGRPGQFRENKIAPIFKQDPMGLGLERNFARAIPHHQFVPRTFGPPRHSRRITGHYSPPPPPIQPRSSSFQTQFIPNTAPSRYIPIHPKQTPKPERLWWEPQPTETVSDTLEAPKALIRDTIHVDAPRIVPYSSVEISSAQSAEVISTERTLSMIQEEDQELEEGSSSKIITSTEGKIVRMQEPFVPPDFVPVKNDSSTKPPNTTVPTKELPLEIKARVISENIKGEAEETTTSSSKNLE